MTVNTYSIEKVFVDVRRAFRLLHQYHRVLQDIAEVVTDTFNLEPYSRWTYGNYPQSKTDLRGRKAWDFLPFYDVALLYFPRHLQHSCYDKDHREGDWMMELDFVADTSYEDSDQKGDVDPTKFESVEQSESQVNLRLWYLNSEIKDKDWHRGIWDPNDYPGEDKCASNIEVDGDIVGKVVEACWNTEEILDRPTLERMNSEFKTLVENKILNISWS